MKKLAIVIGLGLMLGGFNHPLQAQKLSKKEQARTEKMMARKQLERADVFFNKANKQRVLGNLEKAEDLYRKALVQNPLIDAAYYELARILRDKDQQEGALEQALKAVELDPENFWYNQLLANLYQDAGAYDKALEVYKKLVEQEPDKLELIEKLAMAYIYAGDYKGAIGQYNLIEEKIGVMEEVSLQKQRLYLSMNKVEKAARELENLIEAHPGESRYYAMLAELYMANNMENKALDAYLAISRIDPENPYIHISLSDFYRKKGDKENAFIELKKGFGNTRLDIDTKIQILLTYYTVTEIYSNLKEEAMELAEILVQAHPDDPKAFSMYADFLSREKRFEEARDAFRKVVVLDAGKYLIWESLLRVEIELNDMKALQKESLQTIELFPNQPLPYLFQGIALHQQEKYDAAVEQLETGMALVVGDEVIKTQFNLYLGDAYHAIKEYQKSDAAYDKVLLMEPDNSYVLNNYSYYLSLRNEQLEKAEMMSRKAVELDPENHANLDTHGWVLYMLGRYKEARRMIKKALDLGADKDGTVLEHYGDVLYQLGQTGDALEYWQKAKVAGGTSSRIDQKLKDKKLIE